MKQIVSYGAGTNSTAMVIELINRGEQIDAIVFSDTGGERPETYAHVNEFSDWLEKRGYPRIFRVVANTTVHGTPVATLEEECLIRKNLPGIAYGFGSCSDKWKVQPFKAWLRSTGWDDVTVCIGFDAGEAYRADRAEQYQHKNPYESRFPLIEWNMGREECLKAIDAAGLNRPGKSACFFCPSTKKHEILAIKDRHPNLFFRAVQIEQNADLTSIKGLGRNWAWADLGKADDMQCKLDFADARQDVPCGCYDGGAD